MRVAASGAAARRMGLHFPQEQAQAARAGLHRVRSWCLGLGGASGRDGMQMVLSRAALDLSENLPTMLAIYTRQPMGKEF